MTQLDPSPNLDADRLSDAEVTRLRTMEAGLLALGDWLTRFSRGDAPQFTPAWYASRRAYYLSRLPPEAPASPGAANSRRLMARVEDDATDTLAQAMLGLADWTPPA